MKFPITDSLDFGTREPGNYRGAARFRPTESADHRRTFTYRAPSHACAAPTGSRCTSGATAAT